MENQTGETTGSEQTRQTDTCENINTSVVETTSSDHDSEVTEIRRSTRERNRPRKVESTF